MNSGMVNQGVKKRTIIQKLKFQTEAQVVKPAIEEPCAVVNTQSDTTIISAMSMATGDEKNLGIYPIARACNDVASRGGCVQGVQVIIQCPEQIFESRIKGMVESIHAYGAEEGLPILTMDVTVSSKISTCNVIVTAIGSVESSIECGIVRNTTAVPGMDIVLLGEVGLEGAMRLLEMKKEEIRGRFIPSFLKGIDNRHKELCQIKGIQKGIALGATVCHQVPETGILGGLWELGCASNVAMNIELKALTISQEVIEVCEFIGVNPYRVCSCGAVLMCVEQGESFVEKMAEAGYCVSLIGKTGTGNQRVLHNGDDMRYLERPRMNELLTVLEEGSTKESIC